MVRNGRRKWGKGEDGEREGEKKKLIEDIHFIANTETSRICK